MEEKQVKIFYEDFLSIIYLGYSIDMSDYEKEEWMIFLNQVENTFPHMEDVTEISNTVRSSSKFNPVR